MSDAVAITDLVKVHGGGRRLFGGGRPEVRALDGVTVSVRTGETLGVLGESGCGKTTLARCIVGLTAPTSGSIAVEGRSLADLKRAGPAALGRTVQYVFQDPVSSLNPRQSIRTILSRPLRFLAGLDGRTAARRAAELMDSVGLPAAHLDRYPHEFSGGQAQRIGIARALAAGARIVVLDEPVSALDVSVQAQVLRLLDDLKRERGLTYVFISHDLAVVEAIADRVVVMSAGRIVEEGTPRAIFTQPQHPYTRTLVASVPLADFGPAPTAG